MVRAISSEGSGRIRYNTNVRRHLANDVKFRSYYERETTELLQFYMGQIKEDLGPLWDCLPAGAIYHDSYAFLRSTNGNNGKGVPAEVIPAEGSNAFTNGDVTL